MRLIIGSRKSDLARLQAELVEAAIKKNFPEIEISFYQKPSFGDLNLDMDLTKTQSKGVFTSDLHKALKEGLCDIVVHSWKDLPIEMNEDTVIAGTLDREDSRDVLFLKQGWSVKKDLKIFSSSPRREYNLKTFFDFLDLEQSFEVTPVRGNIPTRFKKFLEADVDGFVVAAAAVKRLYDYDDFNNDNPGLWNEILNTSQWCILPESICPSAAAQGALAIEALKSSTEVLKVIEKINNNRVQTEINEERKIHKSFGGGCHLALGVTIFENDFGKTTFASGKVFKELVNRNEFVPKKTYPRKIDKQKIWISSKGFKARREEKSLDCDMFKSSKLETYVFTRSETCPEGAVFSKSKTIYTSGLRSWQKLFKKGIWVNGCLESLGLSFKPDMPWESNEKYWFTRSGVSAPKGYSLKESYDLEGEVLKDSYDGCDYFIWMSGELFVSELKKNPWLKEKTHFFGMGRSYDYVKNNAQIQLDNVYLYSNLEQIMKDISLS